MSWIGSVSAQPPCLPFFSPLCPCPPARLAGPLPPSSQRFHSRAKILTNPSLATLFLFLIRKKGNTLFGSVNLASAIVALMSILPVFTFYHFFFVLLLLLRLLLCLVCSLADSQPFTSQSQLCLPLSLARVGRARSSIWTRYRCLVSCPQGPACACVCRHGVSPRSESPRLAHHT